MPAETLKRECAARSPTSLRNPTLSRPSNSEEGELSIGCKANSRCCNDHQRRVTALKAVLRFRAVRCNEHRELRACAVYGLERRPIDANRGSSPDRLPAQHSTVDGRALATDDREQLAVRTRETKGAVREPHASQSRGQARPKHRIRCVREASVRVDAYLYSGAWTTKSYPNRPPRS
jgi:hypothetical protein